jgi:pyruvate dehydrogenase E2 component (dihydrolipoamide acetyltransferase)
VNAIVRRGTGLWTRDAVDVFFMVARDGGEDLLGAKVEHADAKDPVAVARELERHVRVVRAHRAGALDRTNALLERLPGLLVGPAMKLTEALLYDLGLDLRRFGLPDDPFGSVMVTNVGMFGLPVALAPLVPFARTPVMITVGEIGDTPVAVEGRAVVRPVMTLGVTLDHRVLDGAQGGQLARAFRAVLEDPWGSLGPPVDDARARGPSAPAQA